MSGNIYETRRLVDEYLLFHYGKSEDILGWAGGPMDAIGFPERVAHHAGSRHVQRALDIGTAVGRSAYTLSEYADEVVAIDYSQAFIDAAMQLRDDGSVSVSRLIEGTMRDSIELQRPQTGHPERISYQQGDAMNLPESLGTFDLVLAANLICRLPSPTLFLNRLPALVNTGGRVVLATPCTWLEEFTPPEHFPKGSTLEWLKEVLSAHFTLIRETNEPFLIRETARKFQWTVSQVTVWERHDTLLTT